MEVITQDPITNPVINPNPPPIYISPPVASKTTAEEDMVTAGQRAINLIWEKTQSRIALGVIGFTIVIDGTVTILLVLNNREITVGQTFGISFLNLIAGIVISFYFSRTNHSQIGGVGMKSTDFQQYQGR